MQRRSRTGAALTLAATSLAVALLSGPALAGPASADDLDPAAEALAWTPCPAEAPAPPGEVGPTVPIECATLPVPLDHANPSAGTVDLAVYRLAAADPAQRQGSLVLNPGGPGIATRDFLLEAGTFVPPPLAERYDLVTVDPRGVGASSGLTCGTGQDLTASLDDPIGDQLRFATELADACRAEAPELLSTMTTANEARDLDQVRQALGDEKLTFLGYSYGTLLGAVYAELYPDRVGRLVLDGAFDPSVDYLELMRRQVVGADAALERFFAWCDADAQCQYPGASTEAVWEYLRWRSGETPLPAADGRQVTASQFETASLLAAFAPEPAYPQIGEAFRSAYEGDASALADAYQSYVDTGPAGNYYAHLCGDHPERYDASEVQVAAWQLIDPGTPPLLGPPGGADLRRLRAGDRTAPRGVVGRGGDRPGAGHRQPARPPQPLRRPRSPSSEALGGSRLLTFEGGGHTIAFRGIPCIDEAVVAYLVDGQLPAEGTVCSPPAPPA